MLAAAAVLLVAALVGWAVWGAVTGGDGDGDAGPTLEELASDPQPFVGRTVAVRGAVGAVYERGVFVLGGDDPSGGPVVLVVGAPATVRDGDAVRVRGEVFVLTPREVEERFGFDPQEGPLVEFPELTTIEAESVSVVGED